MFASFHLENGINPPSFATLIEEGLDDGQLQELGQFVDVSHEILMKIPSRDY